ncbi:hypothetical protein LMG24235_03077 [Paraburkholderia sabiae]|nr:hypothetical protein LMG24235_03077 [Paraburkholderia sabiae]CAG9228353.1 hypothetical protein PSAB6_50003 [Paraburkholderia sabiae]
MRALSANGVTGCNNFYAPARPSRGWFKNRLSLARQHSSLTLTRVLLKVPRMDYYKDRNDLTQRIAAGSPAASAQAAATKAAPKKTNILRRLLSPHELATLLLLLHAPMAAFAKPEIPTLQEAGLVETVATDAGESHIRLTPEGNAILRGLGVK